MNCSFNIQLGQQIEPGLVTICKCKWNFYSHFYNRPRFSLRIFTFKIFRYLPLIILSVGSVDGKTPSLACGTIGGKILIHSPHERSTSISDGLPALRFLNLNRKITSLSSGIFVTLIPYPIVLPRSLTPASSQSAVPWQALLVEKKSTPRIRISYLWDLQAVCWHTTSRETRTCFTGTFQVCLFYNSKQPEPPPNFSLLYSPPVGQMGWVLLSLVDLDARRHYCSPEETVRS